MKECSHKPITIIGLFVDFALCFLGKTGLRHRKGEAMPHCEIEIWNSIHSIRFAIYGLLKDCAF
jgi:hypothetical protein